MFCDKCGARIPDGARFCENCGADVSRPDTKPPYAPNAARVQPPPKKKSYALPVVLSILGAAAAVALILIFNPFKIDIFDNTNLFGNRASSEQENARPSSILPAHTGAVVSDAPIASVAPPDSTPARESVLDPLNPNILAHGDYEYQIEDDGSATIINYTGSDTDVIIPYELPSLNGTATVTGISGMEGPAFSGCSFIESVKIPDTVKYIGQAAFSDCTSLVSVNIPAIVESIDRYAFSGCKSLRRIELPKDVRLAMLAFSDCVSLEDVMIPAGTTGSNYNEGTGCPWFPGCNSLTEVVLEYGVTKIPPAAFIGAPIQKITIPDTVTDIVNDVEGQPPFPDTATVYCGAGSYAEAYAMAHGIPYVVDGNTPVRKVGYFDADGFIFPDSDRRNLTDDELSQLNLEQLGYARNEIFARYGCAFKSGKYLDHYSQYAWYNDMQKRDDLDKVYNSVPIYKMVMNDYELANIEKILQYEKRLKG